MFKNYLLVAYRNLQKHKTFTFINITGLAIGLTCFILIALFVHYEYSFDRHHEKSDRIYRIIKSYNSAGFPGGKLSTATPGPLLTSLTSEFPEVEAAAQITKASILVHSGKFRAFEDGIYATPQIFEVFSFEVLSGNPQRALVDPGSIVLTQSMAERLYGDKKALGQTLTVTQAGDHYDGNMPMTVSAVIADPPPTSHIHFDYMISPESSPDLRHYRDRWDSNNYLTYVALRPESDATVFEAGLQALTDRYLADTESYRRNPGRDDLFQTQALTDIHLYSRVNHEFGPNGNILYVYLFSAIAVLILMVACINYINLATARSVTRAREVGVRKALGGQRLNLALQFICEGIVYSFLATLLAACAVQILQPGFNNLTGAAINFEIFSASPIPILLLFSSFIVGILASCYPAFYISGFQPVSVLKGVFRHKGNKVQLRNLLVIVQFTATTALLIGTLVIQQQLHYIQNTDTGVDREHIISIAVKDTAVYHKYAALKETLERHPQIDLVTLSRSDPTGVNSATPFRNWKGATEGQQLLVNRSSIHDDFVDLFGLEIVAGRDLSTEFSSDRTSGILINETFQRELGWETAVGEQFDFFGKTFTIVGVVKDFNFHSLHRAVGPLALFVGDGWWSFNRMLVKVEFSNVDQTISYLRQVMQDFSPNYPLDYYFLDDAFDQMYKTEMQLGQLFSYFTIISLFIAALGLLGLSAFIVQQRTKEIGIRKVLGATLTDILMLLSKDFTRLVFIAFLIGMPLAYYFMDHWLQEFAFRISIGPATFLAAGVGILLVTWLTVSIQSLRVAVANPVDALQDE